MKMIVLDDGVITIRANGQQMKLSCPGGDVPDVSV